MVRNSAGKHDFVVSASMECVWYREVQLNAERHPHRCERSVAVEVMENGSWVISSAAWADMLLAWACDYETRHVVVTSEGCRERVWYFDLRILLCYCLRVIES